MIEQVLIKKTLNARKNIWLEGSVINSPLPNALIEEAELGTGNVEVLSTSEKNATKTIFVAQRVDEPKDTTTSTTMKTTPPKVNVLKPKLRRRK